MITAVLQTSCEWQTAMRLLTTKQLLLRTVAYILEYGQSVLLSRQGSVTEKLLVPGAFVVLALRYSHSPAVLEGTTPHPTVPTDCSRITL